MCSTWTGLRTGSSLPRVHSTIQCFYDKIGEEFRFFRIIWNVLKLPEKITVLREQNGGHLRGVKGLAWDPIGRFLALKPKNELFKTKKLQVFVHPSGGQHPEDLANRQLVLHTNTGRTLCRVGNFHTVLQDGLVSGWMLSACAMCHEQWRANRKNCGPTGLVL